MGQTLQTKGLLAVKLHSWCKSGSRENHFSPMMTIQFDTKGINEKMNNLYVFGQF